MKKINSITKLFSITLLVASSILVSCIGNDAFTIGINDFNAKITAVDKTIAAPLDTITVTGNDLDQVYKIMLNDDNTPVIYVATKTQIKIAVPSSAPLGDVVTINFFFSGKGLAQRVINLQSPPAILKVTPAAAQPGTKIKVMGIELYKAVHVYVGADEVAFTVIDDKTLTLVLPATFVGGTVKIVSATGSESFSPYIIVLGTEYMINDFDGTTQFYTGTSNNGNIDALKTETGDAIQGKFITLPIVDKGSSWGGNFDIYFSGQPAIPREKVTLVLDIKASTAMNVSIMVEEIATGVVYGLTKPITANWQTISIPFVAMGSGYGNNGPDPVPSFDKLKGIKIQPPASSSANNFGQSVSIDNIRFTIAN